MAVGKEADKPVWTPADIIWDAPKLVRHSHRFDPKMVVASVESPAELIYRYHDGPALLLAVTENDTRSDLVFQGDTDDLRAGETMAGHFRTNKMQGLFQVGEVPASDMTCEVKSL